MVRHPFYHSCLLRPRTHLHRRSRSRCRTGLCVWRHIAGSVRQCSRSYRLRQSGVIRRRDNDRRLGVDRAVARHCKYGIVRGTFFAGRQRHEYGGRPFRTEWGGQTVGFRAYRGAHVIVAHVRGNSSLGEIFRVYRVAPRVVGADTGDGEFAGFTAICAVSTLSGTVNPGSDIPS